MTASGVVPEYRDQPVFTAPGPAPTIVFYDTETGGVNKHVDRVAQFAARRTDLTMQPVTPPVNWLCQPANDYLPDPRATLVHGITPQAAQADGLPEPELAAKIQAGLSHPNTVACGYNSIAFDSQFTRALLWRNLLDPYRHEWADGCNRWDLQDVTRLVWALAPTALTVPLKPDGNRDFRLASLTTANGIAHQNAHDAMSDVDALIGLARIIKEQAPRLWDAGFSRRAKDNVSADIQLGRPMLHVSSLYPTDRGCIGFIVPLWRNPQRSNQVIAWHLGADPRALLSLNAQQIRDRLFVPNADLPAGESRLPLVTLKTNASPMLFPIEEAAMLEIAGRWGIELRPLSANLNRTREVRSAMRKVWPDVFLPMPRHDDVDEALYDGFLPRQDAARLTELRLGGPVAMLRALRANEQFADSRVPDLLWRYVGRNAPQHHDSAEALRWRTEVQARLATGPPPLATPKSPPSTQREAMNTA